MLSRILLLVSALALASSPASAHPGHHPLAGHGDHLLLVAMVLAILFGALWLAMNKRTSIRPYSPARTRRTPSL